MSFNKLEKRLLAEASFYERMFADIVQALFRPAARKFFEKIAHDIDTDPETAARFQALVDAKKSWETWKKAMEKEYPHLKGKLD